MARTVDEQYAIEMDLFFNNLKKLQTSIANIGEDRRKNKINQTHFYHLETDLISSLFTMQKFQLLQLMRDFATDEMLEGWRNANVLPPTPIFIKEEAE